MIKIKKKLGKKGSGLITGLVTGAGGLVIAVILVFVIVSTIGDAGLLTSGGTEDVAADNLRANLTAGVGEVSEQIPTVLSVAAMVLIFGVLLILWVQYKRMNVGGTGKGEL